MVDVFLLDESTTPLRYQLMFIGGVPVLTLQVIVRSYSSTMYAGDPIITVTSVLGMTSGCGVYCPPVITGISVAIIISITIKIPLTNNLYITANYMWGINIIHIVLYAYTLTISNDIY